MTDAELAAIKARCEAATPGPWQPWCRDYHFIRPANPYTADPILLLTGPNKADSVFAAHARKDVPALLAEVERLKGREEQLLRDYESMRKALAAAAEGAWD